MMPLTPALWGDTFGMLTDRFGVGWMVNIAGKKGQAAKPAGGEALHPGAGSL